MIKQTPSLGRLKSNANSEYKQNIFEIEYLKSINNYSKSRINVIALNSGNNISNLILEVLHFIQKISFIQTLWLRSTSLTKLTIKSCFLSTFERPLNLYCNVFIVYKSFIFILMGELKTKNLYCSICITIYNNKIIGWS